MSELQLFCAVLDFGKGSKALKLAKKLGASAGHIFLGKGTVESSVLDFLGLNEVRKEVFLTIIQKEQEEEFFEVMLDKFKLNLPNHGIAFTLGLKECFIKGDIDLVTDQKEDTAMVYEALFVIVEKGEADHVVAAAKTAGATGGTVIHGRGSGSKDKSKLFDFEIEPEKDIVLILALKRDCEAIVDAINQHLKLEEPNRGVLFGLNVSRTLGLYEPK